MKKVSIKTAAKNTRQAAAKKPKPKQKARRVVRRTGPSQATLAGLRQTDDPLQLGSSVAYAMDQDTGGAADRLGDEIDDGSGYRGERCRFG